MTIRTQTALHDTKIATPCLVLDREQIAGNYKNFCHKMDEIDISYAGKANLHPDILSLLTAEGAYFDCAFFQEITLVLAAGSHPSNMFLVALKRKSLTLLMHTRWACFISPLMLGRSCKKSPTMR